MERFWRNSEERSVLVTKLEAEEIASNQHYKLQCFVVVVIVVVTILPHSDGDRMF